MKITDSSLFLTSHHYEKETSVQNETLEIWTTGEPEQPNTDILSSKIADTVELSSSGRTQQAGALTVSGLEEMDPLEDLNMRLLKALLEKIFGAKFRLSSPAEIVQSIQSESIPDASPEKAVSSDQENSGWGIIYNYSLQHSEVESTTFNAKGQVRTADGKQIDIDIGLNMSREFFTSEQLSVRAGDALKDPLVIDFAGTGVELTKQTFSFDIDADGQQNQIAFVKPGAGFLAWDKNNDGVINDGKELFGALSGDGFADLSLFDDDENGWIDENDSLYSHLRIWTKDDQGNDSIVALAEKGIGAIYLGNISTAFSLKDSNNDLQGVVRTTGIFLKQDGQAGTIQQIDLVA
ncbi:hypothetical protein [Desulfogranum japonicum]|uniref:hypothetical protein n=1 Tax=Desulfogranum japonicum TaxID=231447 RepID=UPI00041226B5|nr:hypothetical protein [Desulfogranum japonicum]